MQFHAQTFQVADCSRLGSRIGAAAGQAAIPGDTCNSDQTTLPDGAHERNKGLKEVHHADNIRGENILKNLLVFGTFGKGAVTDARVGDDDIGTTMTDGKIFCRSPQGSSITHIGDVEGYFRFRPLLRRKALQQIRPPRNQAERCAAVGVMARQCPPEPGGGATDNDF